MAGMNDTNPVISSPFGKRPYTLFDQLYKSQISPLFQGLGFNPSEAYQRRLDQASGPLAGLIRDTQSFAGGMIPEARDISAKLASQAPLTYDAIKGQIDSAMAALPNYQGTANDALGYAKDMASNAFDPVRSRALYDQTLTRALAGAAPGFAARGVNDTGSAAANEQQVASDLSFQTAQTDQANQSNALQALTGTNSAAQQMSTAGIPLAGEYGNASNALAQTLTQANLLPAQTASQLLQLLTAGQAPALQMLQTSAPTVSTEGKGWRVI